MTLLSQSWGFPGALPSHNRKSSFRTESRGPNNIGFKVAHPFTRQHTGGCSSSNGHSFKLACLSNGVDGITDIIHNKVLIAAAVSAAIGQLSKPFTSAIFYGNNFDIRTVFQAGGFPSTHSSTVIATATSIGLERGFSDAVFGLAVVYAGLVMYDAQGVRREVGIHAKVLNRLLLETRLNETSSNNGAPVLTDNSQEKPPSNVQILEPCVSEELNSVEPELKKNTALFLKPDNQKISQKITSNAEDGSKQLRYSRLKESIGHTEVEVVAGALLGFLVSLAVCLV